MLFELPVKKEDERSETAGASLPGSGEQGLPVSYKLNTLMDQVKENSCVHWLTEGDWSMHDLLLSVLQLAGPADVYLSSYAFSEYPARLIADFIALLTAASM
jgi:hypothetical protein